MAAYTLFFGTFIDLPRTPADGKHELSIHHGALWVGYDGLIKGFDWNVRDEGDLQALIEKKEWVLDNGENKKSISSVKVIIAREDQNEFFFPGFIDTHIHASQYPNSGLFGSSTLLDWLQTYTFPLESSFGKSISSARKIYNQVVSRTLAHGTTCAAYFATIHVPATNALADLCLERGQRALIGRVCMDNPDICPDYYRDASPEESLSATQTTISHIHTIDPFGSLVKPIITPRFAPSCSTTAMKNLGQLAASYSPPLHIQTHISENKDEISLVHKLFPESKNYADVYDRFNLLTPRTILAHGVHLTKAERTLIQSRQSKISHCPASNSALGSGLCPVRRLLDSGITVGLGTDTSGGYSPSILEAVRQALLVSRLLPHTVPSDEEGKKDESQSQILSVEDGLYLATRGGAAVVDMANEIGGFDLGMSWDAQLIQLGYPASSVGWDGTKTVGSVDVFGWESWSEKVHKWVWTGSDRNVKSVWVLGKLVHSRRDVDVDGDCLEGLTSIWKSKSIMTAFGAGLLLAGWVVRSGGYMR
ncbi:hypothetical protein ASPWEDRAFT_30338 [Aspergillus wentii DTO 134E9]|uniref:Guanine deaminase n=1 Tax=Aspergillus wentii DTO 134E9 TaxID=1073089 RepID=A0A1L9RED0_ASPWE|nr:uncharacterized protein ASPWEDRAFT_30338 [Aspergillus wentii DTO 134E9]KAI9933492.1 hypothetical protein MW887_007965 [Aspergillus wentii]OJJ33238.1 hypothetical protein ASPWEDRAFT_30338 [Aspergillus wentii DTO 134E9]